MMRTVCPCFLAAALCSPAAFAGFAAPTRVETTTAFVPPPMITVTDVRVSPDGFAFASADFTVAGGPRFVRSPDRGLNWEAPRVASGAGWMSAPGGGIVDLFW